ncbi:helix-turn-helix domain-containing protein [Kitasatospora sp. NPDC052868]|uniref:helix-turn-helix domain-containing protein n=1 Tax=Kitasatospora sp. NPDC052868 TaxID=3364060 RepID=UPI0037C68EAA
MAGRERGFRCGRPCPRPACTTSATAGSPRRPSPTATTSRCAPCNCSSRGRRRAWGRSSAAAGSNGGRADLARPDRARDPIHAVAARWGFTSAAAFSRAFRQEYGSSPREYRQNALRGPSCADPQGTLRVLPTPPGSTRLTWHSGSTGAQAPPTRRPPTGVHHRPGSPHRSGPIVPHRRRLRKGAPRLRHGGAQARGGHRPSGQGPPAVPTTP